MIAAIGGTQKRWVGFRGVCGEEMDYRFVWLMKCEVGEKAMLPWF